MEHGERKEIEKIIGDMKCPRDFRCYKSGLEDLCKAKDIGMSSFLLCLEENPQGCRFSLWLGDVYFCECPLRIYLAKKLKK